MNSSAPKWSYEDAFDLVLGIEGGYVNNPNDHGGPTNFGVTQRTYDVYRVGKRLPTRSVRFITKGEALEIYKEFWDDSKAGLFYPAIGLCLFDTAINSGPHRAIMLLQQALPVPIDGKVGPQTILAVQKKDKKDLVNGYLDKRRYFLLVLSASPTQAGFRNGWMNRVARIRREALALLDHTY